MPVAFHPAKEKDPEAAAGRSTIDLTLFTGQQIACQYLKELLVSVVPDVKQSLAFG